MTDIQLSSTLGIIQEPIKNKVHFSNEQAEQFMELTFVLRQAESQQKLLKPTTENLWVEFLPWHSLN
jgi:hypothetical protein